MPMLTHWSPRYDRKRLDLTTLCLSLSLFFTLMRVPDLSFIFHFLLLPPPPPPQHHLPCLSSPHALFHSQSFSPLVIICVSFTLSPSICLPHSLSPSLSVSLSLSLSVSLCLSLSLSLSPSVSRSPLSSSFFHSLSMCLPVCLLYSLSLSPFLTTSLSFFPHLSRSVLFHHYPLSPPHLSISSLNYFF